MIILTAPMVNKLSQLIASGGGGGEGGSVDLTPVLAAVAAVSTKADALQLAVDAIELAPGGEGGSVDLTPVLSAVAGVSTKTDALQLAVDAIEIPAGSGGSVIKSKQTLNISQLVSQGTTANFPISPIDPNKTFVNCISFAAFVVSTLNMVLEADNIKITNTSGSTNYTPILKLELIEYA